MYYLTEEQFKEIEDARNNSTSGYPNSDMYAKIYEILQQTHPLNDLFDEDGNPIEGEVDVLGNSVEGSVKAWFGAATQANRGEGGASTFIRDYTEAQIVARTGAPMVDRDAELQAASDAIAAAVFEDIQNTTKVIDGVTYHIVPNAHKIGEKDAAKSLQELTEYSNDPGIWSGNALYLGLGDTSFWFDEIINDSADTYDFLVSYHSFNVANFSTFFAGGSGDLVSLFFDQGGQGMLDGLSATASGLGAANTFLLEAYGAFARTGLGVLSR